jgi:predicted DNA-binding transcriptional regulator AlpA
MGGKYMSKNLKITEQQNLQETGLLRLKQILQFIPVNRSTWLAGIKTGRFPKPLKLGPRTTAWRAVDINTLINYDVQNESKNNIGSLTNT